MVELREFLRSHATDELLIEKIYSAIAAKPKGHAFLIEKDNIRGISRHISELGG